MEVSPSGCSRFRIDSLLSLRPPSALLSRGNSAGESRSPPELSPRSDQDSSGCSAPPSPRREPVPRVQSPLHPGQLVQPRAVNSSFLIRDILADCRPLVACEPYSDPGQNKAVPGQNKAHGPPDICEPYSDPGQPYSNPGQPYSDPGQSYSDPGHPYSDQGQHYSDPGQSYSDPGQAEAESELFQSGLELDYTDKTHSNSSSDSESRGPERTAEASGRLKKPRKARTAFSEQQLARLESSFSRQKYLSVQDRMELAAALHLSDTQVKTWYQNRRTKWKRQSAVGLELLAEAGRMFPPAHFLYPPAPPGLDLYLYRGPAPLPPHRPLLPRLLIHSELPRPVPHPR